MSEEQLFEDFISYAETKIIKKCWSVTYAGKEITGIYEYQFGYDDWGYSSKTVKIDEECLRELTEEEIDEIIEYIEDTI
jgi:hypothetical protein